MTWVRTAHEHVVCGCVLHTTGFCLLYRSVTEDVTFSELNDSWAFLKYVRLKIPEFQTMTLRTCL